MKLFMASQVLIVVFDMVLVSTVIVISWFKVIQRRGVVKRVAVVELSVPSHFSAAMRRDCVLWCKCKGPLRGCSPCSDAHASNAHPPTSILRDNIAVTFPQPTLPSSSSSSITSWQAISGNCRLRLAIPWQG